MKRTTKTLTTFMIVFSLALTACANQPAAAPQSTTDAAASSPEGIVAEGKPKPIHAANLSFQARGTVEEIRVKIGDAVKH